MKKITAVLLILITIVIVSCGGGSEPAPIPIVNKAPSIPTLVYPSNSLLCINNTVDFTWNSSVDPEGDNVTYEIILAKDSQFTLGVQTKNTATLTSSFTLDKGTAYYWKVKALDSKSKASEYTSQWGFYTEGIGLTNYAPFVATLIKPAINTSITTGTSVDLEWNATDIDNDPLKYDIYIETSTTLTTPIVQDHTLKTYTKTGLTPNTTYYWRIDVKDTKGAKTIGQIWSFKTS